MPIDRNKVQQQAQLLASRGQYDAAITEWKKLAVETPGAGGIHNSIGDLQLKRNAPIEAATAYLQAASAFRSEGATLKAIAAFKKVLKCDPSRYEVYRHLGDLNAERGLTSSAVQDYQTLGKYYLKERRGKEALEIYKKIVSQDPSNLNAQQRVAELCVQENLQDEATKVYLQLGRERSAQGRYDEARDAYQSVLRIDPKNSEAVQFVESMQKTGTGTVKTVKPPVASSTPKASEPLDILAEVTRRIDEKQYAGAEAILNQMLTREPGNPQVCQLLAKVHLQRGDVQVALGEYRFLAGAALRAHDFPLAESLIQEFLSVQPHSVPLLELYGEFYEEQGNATTAAVQYAKAIELLLEHPEPGMESLHEELFEKVRALSTDDALVRRLQARMQGTSVTEPADQALVQGTPVSDMNEPSVVEQQEAPQPVRFSPQQFAQEPDAGDSVGGESHVASSNVEGGQSTWTEMPVSPPAMEESSLMAAGATYLADEVAAVPSPQIAPTAIALAMKNPASQSPTMMRKPLLQEPPSPPPDYEAHYLLGVAYKNMGLYEEAQEEFQVSRKNEVYAIDSALIIALCHKEQGRFPEAIQELETALTNPSGQGAKGQAIRYELGLLYEAGEQWDKALQAFQSIPAFHDVPQRLLALRGKQQGGSRGFRYAA